MEASSARASRRSSCPRSRSSQAPGIAASKDKPHNVNPPVVTGTPQEGKTLTGDRGDWSNSPTDYNYAWLRCGKTGGSCAVISGAHATKYTLTSADVGNTLRFRVIAKNADGQTTRPPRCRPP